MISELRPECCELGATYLFFLSRVRKPGIKVMESVEGRFGIVKWAGVAPGK